MTIPQRSGVMPRENSKGHVLQASAGPGRRRIIDDYSIKRTIGQGGFAKVKLARHRLTNQKVGIKIVDKSALKRDADMERLDLELKILKQLKHQNICQLYEIRNEENKCYIVMEYASGGELFDYIVAHKKLKEHHARKFFRQIVVAVAHCHKNKVFHRDLKPENLLLDNNQRNVKLIDFGLVSQPDSAADLLKTCCGSPAYAAPELVKGIPYVGEKADMWSLGVLLYALLCGFLPFDNDDLQLLYKQIELAEYTVPHWVSPESTRLLSRLLHPDPEKRISCRDLLKHSWIHIGYNKKEAPLKIDSSIETDAKDMEILNVMTEYYGMDCEELAQRITNNAFHEVSVTYNLLKKAKSEGRPLKLHFNASTSCNSSHTNLDLYQHNIKQGGMYEMNNLGYDATEARIMNIKPINHNNGKSSQINQSGSKTSQLHSTPYTEHQHQGCFSTYDVSNNSAEVNVDDKVVSLEDRNINHRSQDNNATILVNASSTPINGTQEPPPNAYKYKSIRSKSSPAPLFVQSDFQLGLASTINQQQQHVFYEETSCPNLNRTKTGGNNPPATTSRGGSKIFGNFATSIRKSITSLSADERPSTFTESMDLSKIQDIPLFVDSMKLALSKKGVMFELTRNPTNKNVYLFQCKKKNFPSNKFKFDIQIFKNKDTLYLTSNKHKGDIFKYKKIRGHVIMHAHDLYFRRSTENTSKSSIIASNNKPISENIIC